MKIAFDARWLFQGGHGDVTYLRNLIRALARVAGRDEFWLYYREFDALRESLTTQHPNIHTRQLNFPIGSLWNQLALSPALKREKMDVLHGNYMLPTWAPCPMVVTIHDATFRLFPEWIPSRAARIMNVLIPLSAQRATHILTVSECSKRDIVRCFGIAPEKVTVAYNGVSPQFMAHDPLEAHRRVREAYPQLSGPFIAGIGLRGARKNIGVVLRAILQLQERGVWPDDTKFAVAGTREQFPDAEFEKLQNTVVFLGFADEALLPDIFAAAQCSVYPSLYEGFGLPVLEAMACGCPVVCSDTSSLPEVAGGAGAMLSPTDEESWANVLESVLHDENHRAVLRDRGIKRAAEFSWEKCARATLKVYKEVTGKSHG